MKRLGLLLVAGGLVLALGVGALAADRWHTFPNIDLSRPLALDFGDYRIRVDGWERQYVEVEVTGQALTPLTATCQDNVLRFRAEEFRQPRWEPAFRIKVPRSLPVRVTAGDLWAKDCTVVELQVQVAYLRDCTLQTIYRQQRPLHPQFDWWSFRWRTDGWQVIRFK